MERIGYGIIGNPLSNSKSQFIQNTFARQKDKKISYEKILSSKDDFKEDVNHFFSMRGKGLNVTAPFKEDAYKLVDQLTERARVSKSVNTLMLLSNGKLVGDNTDGVGLVLDLKRLNVDIENKKVLIIGAGGASRGILKPILDEKPSSVIIANRTHESAFNLSYEFKKYGNIIAKQISEIKSSFDLIINATSGDVVHKMGFHKEIFTEHTFIYDITYKNELTSFIRYAETNGCHDRSDGAGMLVYQGAESFNLWHEEYPNAKKVIIELREMMKSTS